MTIGLLQPIEITASNNTFTVTCGGMGPTTFNLTVGTQPSLLTILREIDDHFVVTFAGAVTPALSTDHLVEFHSDLALTVVFDDPALGQLLGFRANIPLTAGPCTVTATDTPERCWFPEFVTENRHRWRRDHERAYSGSQAHDGTLSGVEVGPEVYRQRLVFQDVRAVGALVEAQQDSYLWAGDTIYPDERRSWETFFHSVRASVTVNDAAAACHGVYYLPDIGVYETDDPAVTPVVYPATMGTGGIRYELTTDPDTFTFAHTKPTPPPDPEESLDGSILYYRIEIDLLTAPAPEWVTVAAPAPLGILVHDDGAAPQSTTLRITANAGVALSIGWGDGTFSSVTCDGAPRNYTHNYAAGTFGISLYGSYQSITRFECNSHVWIYGDIADFAALTSLVYLRMYVLTNLTGTIAALVGLVNIRELVVHQTGVSGDFAVLVTMVDLDEVWGYSTAITYSTGVHPAGWANAHFYLHNNAWPTASVDQIMIDHDAIGPGAYSLNLKIDGTNAARTNPGAGENARASLVAKGKAVSVN